MDTDFRDSILHRIDSTCRRLASDLRLEVDSLLDKAAWHEHRGNGGAARLALGMAEELDSLARRIS
jgi:hypothetical protein